MPIIEISALPPRNDVDVPTALASVTTSVASFLGEEPRGTWAIWRPVEPGAYAEGAEAPSVQPPDTHPAIVDVFAGRRDDAAMLMTVVGKAVVDAFGLHDGNVVVRLTDANPDHLYWGV
jgi:phenylpyruvate tautomerase PptA (4-oxalocrotonate tautomerase family)